MKTTIKKILEIKNLEYYLLVIFLIFGFVVRLYKINSPIGDWHSFRQVDTASVTRLYIENGINLLYPKYHDISRVQSGKFNPDGYRFVEFPFFNLIHICFVKLFPFITLEVLGRFVSIFSALGTAYLLYLLGKRFISVSGGLIASFFYLFLPYNIYFTRVILPEPLAIFFGTSALLIFVKFIDFGKQRYVWFSALFLAIALLIKPYMAFYAIPMLFLALQKYSIKKAVKVIPLYVFVLITLIPFIAWRLWISKHPEGIPFWKWTFNGDGIRFKPAFWYWILGERLTKLILGYLGLIPFSIGLIINNSKNKFILSYILGMGLYVLVFATANVRHDYYQSITIPAIALVFSAGALALWQTKEFNKILTRGLLIVTFVIMLLTGLYQVKEYYKINHPEIIDAGMAVDKLTPKDALVIASYNGDTAFLYYTKRRGWPVVELPIDSLISEGAEYYTSVNLNDKQTQEFMTRFSIMEKTNTFVILNLKKENK